MNFNQYKNYFKSIQEDNSNTIVDFHVGNMEEVLLDELPRDMQTPLLFLEVYTKSTHMATLDNIKDNIAAALLILKAVPERDSDEEDMVSALNDTEVLIEVIKKQMVYDSTHECDTMRGLYVDSFRTQKVGPVFDNMYGWRLSFNFLEDNALNNQ